MKQLHPVNFAFDPTGREVVVTFRWREFRNNRTGEKVWCRGLHVSADRSIPRETIREAFRVFATQSAELGKEA